MSFALNIEPDAEADMAEAHAWYEGQRETLGTQFIESVRSTFRAITENPRRFPRVHTRIRRATVPRFPFAVYFEIRGNEIKIIAVWHAKRSSLGWRRRT